MTGHDAACRECGRNEAAEDGQHHLPIGLAMGSVERASHARDRGRRSELVTSVIASVGRSDAGSCSDGGIDVRQGVAALVANGNGADAGSAHGMRGSSRGGEVRQGRDGRTRGRAIVIAAGDAARSRRCAVRFRAVLMEGTVVARLLQCERPPTVRSTGADAMPGWRRERTSPSFLRAAVPAQSRRQVRGVAREPVDGEAVAGAAAMRMGTASRSPSPAQRSVPVLRGERPPTVRSTGRDAMPRLRRGGTGVRARAAQARMRRAATREGGTAKRGEPIAAEAATGS